MSSLYGLQGTRRRARLGSFGASVGIEPVDHLYDRF